MTDVTDLSVTQSVEVGDDINPDERNAATVGAIYAAFGRGDVGFMLGQLTDDVSWDEGLRATAVPWLQPGRGKDHVLAFFGALGAGLTFTTFEPGPICAKDGVVIVPVKEVATSLTTGRTIDEDVFVHLWRFGDDGKVASFRHIGDLARYEAIL